MTSRSVAAPPLPFPRKLAACDSPGDGLAGHRFGGSTLTDGIHPGFELLLAIRSLLSPLTVPW